MKEEELAIQELKAWQEEMVRKPTFLGRVSKGLQTKINERIPQKIHSFITTSIKNMVRAVLLGSEYTTKHRVMYSNKTFAEKEKVVKDKLSTYKKTAAIEGAGTGAGGVILGLTDFPLLLGIKMKFLFEIASIYGFNVKDYKERIYILYIFQLAFSSDKKRKEIYLQMLNWDVTVNELPADLNNLDWQSFQQEYRDYIDLVKLLQLVPGVGAVFGAYANYRLLEKLGKTAMNSYRLRLFKNRETK